MHYVYKKYHENSSRKQYRSYSSGNTKHGQQHYFSPLDISIPFILSNICQIPTTIITHKAAVHTKEQPNKKRANMIATVSNETTRITP